MAQASLGLRPQLLRVRDASGGLNVRDAVVAHAVNESPDVLNVTLDERGGVAKRLGYAKENPTAFGGAGDKCKNLFYSEAIAEKVTQAGASLYKGNSTTAFKTFTTAARCGFADFLVTGSTVPKLFFIHPVDGLFYYDGTTVTAVGDVDAPKGDVLFAWQNKLFANNSVVKARVAWSAIADGSAWAAADFNDLREKDGEQVVNLKGVGGESVATGKQGLVACKRESVYRIISATTGEYVTIDPEIGTASALSMVSVGGRIISISERGVFWTDGQRPMREASETLRPLFTATRLNMAQLDLVAAGAEGGRVTFSVPEAGETKNTLAFEYHPAQGWIVPRSDAMACYATYGKDTERLLGGSPTVDGQVYHLNKGGSDDGTAISSRWQSRWFEPNDGILTALFRLQLLGRTEGVATLTVRKNYESSGGKTRQFSIIPPGFTYDSGLRYDQGHKYGTPRLLDYEPFYSLGTCKSFSIIITETSSLLGTGPQYLQRGAAPEVGAWAIYGFDLQHAALGLA